MKKKTLKTWLWYSPSLLTCLSVWYWLFYRGVVGAHPELIRELTAASQGRLTGLWPVSGWINRGLFQIVGTNQRVFWLESLLASISLSWWWMEWIRKKRSNWWILILTLPWLLWQIGRQPLELIFTLYLTKEILGEKESNWQSWLVGLIGLGVSKVICLLGGYWAIKKKTGKKTVVILLVALMLLGGQIKQEWQTGQLSQYQSKNISQTINLRLGTEFTASGDNLLPLKIKRLVFNKMVWPVYQIAREGVSLVDIETWFFPYQMQQDLVWKEGLTEKNIMMVFDGLILIMLLIGWQGRKKDKELALTTLAGLVVAGMIWGKIAMGEISLLTLPLVMLLGSQAGKKLEKNKLAYLLMPLVLLSVGTRVNLMVNKEELWRDNRAITYRFISKEIEDKEEQINISSAFGSAEIYVEYYLNSKEEKENLSYGALPEGDIWPAGIYAGLEGEFEEIENEQEILAERTISDEISKGLGKRVLVVRIADE